MELITESCTQPAYYEWTPEQSHARELLSGFLDGPPGVFVLSGYAGTGKTTLAVDALRRVPGSICFTAPTHKAVGVLWGKGLVQGADYATIHRLLGCRRYRKNGESQFLPDFDRAAWSGCDVIVADEISMVGETMWGWLMDAQTTWPRHLICLGDIAQLPPVADGDGLSPAFKRVDAQLTEVMRSAGIVSNAAATIRLQLNAFEPIDVELGVDDLGVVERLDKDAFMAAALADFRSDADAKVLAWTNDAVNFVNAAVRRELFGNGVDVGPQPGERLVVVSTWSHEDESVMLHAEDDITVRSVRDVTHHGFEAWRIDALGVDVPLYQLKPGSTGDYKRELMKLKSLCVDKKKPWTHFYRLEDAFVRLRPGYATTVHKSQGSTYETAYVIDRNLKACPDHKTRNMLRYVAFSRASKRLVLS